MILLPARVPVKGLFLLTFAILSPCRSLALAKGRLPSMSLNQALLVRLAVKVLGGEVSGKLHFSRGKEMVVVQGGRLTGAPVPSGDSFSQLGASGILCTGPSRARPWLCLCVCVGGMLAAIGSTGG